VNFRVFLQDFWSLIAGVKNLYKIQNGVFLNSNCGQTKIGLQLVQLADWSTCFKLSKMSLFAIFGLWELLLLKENI